MIFCALLPCVWLIWPACALKSAGRAGQAGGGFDIFRRKFIFPSTATVVGGIGVPVGPCGPLRRANAKCAEGGATRLEFDVVASTSNNDTHRNIRYGIYLTVLPFHLVATQRLDSSQLSQLKFVF